jgi:hypothetical protein
MTNQIETLMALADNYADWVEYAESRQALQSALEAVLGQPQDVPGHEADVWHEGSQSFYRAKLLYKLTPEEVDAAPPAQTKRLDSDESRLTPKGLFVDLIAQHPGLAEELKAIDDAPIPTWTPPRLTDDTITIAYQMGSNHSDGLRNIETAVRKQFGYE